MNAIEAAILRTVVYADVFNFPLTADEVHQFLIDDCPASLESVRAALANSTCLAPLLEAEDGYYVRAGRRALIAVRRARECASQSLWPQAVCWGTRLARLPFVRMVALSGALAVRNAAGEDDDLDYLLVTAPGRVWLARAFAILLVRIGRLRGVEICPNYILAEDRLLQQRVDLFTAHEVAQMVPIYGFEVYRRMREENAWSLKFLPNAWTAFNPVDEQPPGRLWNTAKRAVEALLSGRLGDRLEGWEFRRKLRRFAPQIHRPNSSAQIDDHMVKGHFDDHGQRALDDYQERLLEYGLALEESEPA